MAPQMNRRKALGAIGSIGALSLAGCSGPLGGGGTTTLTMMTSTEDTAAYQMSQGLAAVVNEESDSIEISARPGDGAKQSMRLLDQEEADIAYTDTLNASRIYNEAGDYSCDGAFSSTINQVFHYYDIQGGLATQGDSDIRTVNDLAGAAVSPNPVGTAMRDVMMEHLSHAEFNLDDMEQLALGYGEEAGAPLTEHGAVDKLSFTGSVPVGQAVMAAASETVTPVTLELGGKSPFIVFPDADLDQAAATSAAGLFYNTGQSCDACSRILVHEDVHDDFLDRYVAEAEETWRPGDPLAEGTTMGPLTFADQLEKTSNYVDVGQAEGADLVCGGDAPDDDALADGYFFEPTVFDGVDNDMRIAQEEIFGPVQSVITFSDYDEAIRLANDVDYGLASGVATSDSSLAHRAAADIEAGSVWVNEYHGGGPGIPFGGYKHSGFGRECAKETLSAYTHSKAVNVALDEPDV